MLALQVEQLGAVHLLGEQLCNLQRRPQRLYQVLDLCRGSAVRGRPRHTAGRTHNLRQLSPRQLENARLVRLAQGGVRPDHGRHAGDANFENERGLGLGKGDGDELTQARRVLGVGSDALQQLAQTHEQARADLPPLLVLHELLQLREQRQNDLVVLSRDAAEHGEGGGAQGGRRLREAEHGVVHVQVKQLLAELALVVDEDRHAGEKEGHAVERVLQALDGAEALLRFDVGVHELQHLRPPVGVLGEHWGNFAHGIVTKQAAGHELVNGDHAGANCSQQLDNSLVNLQQRLVAGQQRRKPRHETVKVAGRGEAGVNHCVSSLGEPLDHKDGDLLANALLHDVVHQGSHDLLLALEQAEFGPPAELRVDGFLSNSHQGGHLDACGRRRSMVGPPFFIYICALSMCVVPPGLRGERRLRPSRP
mmetsp:Transcript_8952/g.20589  ORF Transcript_8952/g.20589 Transcript_8952/m.20589 type:complete len:422 (-) Transcript_8952:800-2065(-)